MSAPLFVPSAEKLNAMIYNAWRRFDFACDTDRACQVLYGSAESAQFRGQLILLSAIAHLRGVDYDTVAIPFDLDH